MWLDVPGTLHHVILREFDRGRIVTHARDRATFVARLSAVATTTGTILYVGVLLSNHTHRMLRNGHSGLP